MLYLVFFDGPDGCGKSTLIKNIKQRLPYVLIKHSVYCDNIPSNTGVLGFTKSYLFDETTKIPGEIRQMIHTCDNMCKILEYYYTLRGDSIVLFDRSLISTLVYSKLLGVSDSVTNHLVSNQIKLLGLLRSFGDFDYHFIVLDHDEGGFRQGSDGSIYEQDKSLIYDLYRNFETLYPLNPKTVTKYNVTNNSEEVVALDICKVLSKFVIS